MAELSLDTEGLKRAALELLEEGFVASRVARSLADAGEEGRERLLGSLPQLTLSPGYYKRAEFLMWLEEQKKHGLVGGEWLLSEAQGLAAVAQARVEFERLHPACPYCGALQDSQWATSCRHCGVEFMKRSA